jgi:ferredoxin
MRIEVDCARCEGNGQCVVDAPDVFDLDEDDNLIVFTYDPPPEHWAQVEAAVRSCPKRALAIADDAKDKGAP